MAIPALGVIPWITAQGSRFRKIPALLYMWLTIVGPAILLLLYGHVVPIWYAALALYMTGHVGAVIALQSSGATVSDPEHTKEASMLFETAKMLTDAMEKLKDIIDDKTK